MKPIQRPAIFALTIGLAVSFSTRGFAQDAPSQDAPSLSIGDAAPQLKVGSFVKGEPVKTLEPGKVYVVEFWATWCGPCRATIPHLTELQKKNPKATFIGVSVFESDPKDVEPFVKEMGDKMDYRVALDDLPDNAQRGDGEMANNWMKAANQNGIPTAFIINQDNKVAWIGHPMKLEEPLEKVLAGSWDVKAAAAEFKKEAEEQTKFMTVQKKIVAAIKAENPKNLLDVIDESIKTLPAMGEALAPLKLATLIKVGDEDKALKFGKELLQGQAANDWNFLNSLAWAVVDPESKTKPTPKLIQFAVEAAKKGDELEKGKNPAIADTLAKAYYDAGDVAKALETQTRALENAKGTDFEGNEEMVGRLEQYKKAASK